MLNHSLPTIVPLISIVNHKPRRLQNAWNRRYSMPSWSFRLEVQSFIGYLYVNIARATIQEHPKTSFELERNRKKSVTIQEDPKISFEFKRNRKKSATIQKDYKINLEFKQSRKNICHDALVFLLPPWKKKKYNFKQHFIRHRKTTYKSKKWNSLRKLREKAWCKKDINPSIYCNKNSHL